ncbi:glutathione ABC transporter substrate-binding protein [Jeotgalibacillus sp. R-1-5s-1]|uniref:glutathione ABC transporter substrate-binding protein n=1 Tax=Jeotgalibacillus sp. R-1-5s-1 TaxID=2555897 RepID=UPI00106AF4D4|nr:glutathione ABC transporter substrate-binding protein [Jeotgalibacillus sp. R-1-5s-1]TFD94456.1 glutathione ABC transporter substrate-binding protein [Jeotgalibacillus sp. R-1-5s-1]
MKKAWIFTAMILLTLVLSACAGGSESSSSEGSSSDGSGELVIATLSDAVSMDVHLTNDIPSANMQIQVYERLVTQDENAEIQPALAESWETIDDVTWEFKLREGVEFHDETPFNAEAVKANFDRILDEEIGSPRAVQFEMVESVEVVDDYTVRFNLSYPFAPLLANLSNVGGSIVSPASIEADYEAVANGEQPGTYVNNNPAGTGFLKFDSWTPGEEMILVKNEDYWDGAVDYDSVKFQIVPEGSTRVANLETGYAHIIDPLAPNEAARVEQLENASLTTQDSVGLNYIGFNLEKEPFNDVRVRQAISMAINKEEIINGIYDGYGTVATGPLAPPVPNAANDLPGLEYDVEQAKALLAEAGYENGFDTTIWTNDNPERENIAVAVQDALSQIGVNVEVEVLEWGAYLDQTAQGNHDMFILGWSNQNANADNGLYSLFHSSQIGSAGNRFMLRDEEIDANLEEARQTNDEAVQAQLYRDAQERLIELAPMIYLQHQTYLAGHADDVEGFWMNPSGLYQLKDVVINES